MILLTIRTKSVQSLHTLNVLVDTTPIFVKHSSLMIYVLSIEIFIGIGQFSNTKISPTFDS